MSTLIPSDRDWRIDCSGARLDQLRADPAFHQLLALARLMNALRFAQVAFADANDLTGPAGDRQRINAFFFISALLYEGIQLAQRMAKHFRTHRSWKPGLGALLKDQRFSVLFSDNLKPARDRVTFHIDEEEIAGQLALHPTEDVTLVRATGPEVRDVYYDFSDFLALRTFIGPTATQEELHTRASELFAVARDLALAFLAAADGLVAAVLKDMGFAAETIEHNSADA